MLAVRLNTQKNNLQVLNLSDNTTEKSTKKKKRKTNGVKKIKI